MFTSLEYNIDNFIMFKMSGQGILVNESLSVFHLTGTPTYEEKVFDPVESYHSTTTVASVSLSSPSSNNPFILYFASSVNRCLNSTKF
jgi:hypothetical protein